MKKQVSEKTINFELFSNIKTTFHYIKICSDKINQGGGVAAPVGGQIFSEILPYLEVNQGNQDEVEVVEEVVVPNVIGLSITEAEKTLKEIDLELSIKGIATENKETLDKENTIIKEQTPTEGIKINKGNKVFVEY